jgi:DNA-binding transcriptional ArsR family regulator
MDTLIPDPLIAEAAALIGDPTRAKILGVLMDGRARTSKELAALGGVTPATASGHIAKMTAAGLVGVSAQGRHRYVRLANGDVAEILERLMTLAGAARPPRAPRNPAEAAFRDARTCYDHLAGRLAADLIEALQRRDLLRRSHDGFEPTLGGERWFRALGVDVARARCQTRAFARCCLDWSERRDHLAGALGAGLLAALVERGVVARQRDGRTLNVTPEGRRFFAEETGSSKPAPAAPPAVATAQTTVAGRLRRG